MTTDAAAQAYAAAAAYELQDHGGNNLVVLLHGLGGDRNQPLGLSLDGFAELAGSSAGLGVLAPDARAHGDTKLIGDPERFSSANLAHDVLALIDRLHLADRMLIPVGISMGAAVGLHLITDHPHRVAGAVLIRPSFGPEPWPPHLQVFRQIAALLRAHGPDGLKEFTDSPEYRDHLAVSPSATSSLREQFTKPLSVQRVVRLETVPANTAVEWSRPVELGMPVTVIGAHDDPGHPLKVARLWHKQLAGSHLIEVPSRDTHPQAYRRDLDRATTGALHTIRRGTPPAP